MKCALVAGLLAVSVLAPSVGAAHPNDFSLLGLGRPDAAALSDPTVRRYRALSAELAMAMAPKALQPAETLGMSGFELAVASTATGISSDEDYWRGQAGTPIFEGPLRDRDIPNTLWVPTLVLRKGLPLSTDVGVSFGYLASSGVMMLGAEAKVALYESYLRYVPALALRGAFGRLLGATDLDLITGEADVMTSMAFGIGGMAQVTPYAGVGVLFAHVNSQVIDETPYDVSDIDGDQRGGASGSLYTFPTLEWHKNQFTRIFGGLRVNIAMLTLSYSLDVGLIPYSFAKKTMLSHSFKLGFDV